MFVDSMIHKMLILAITQTLVYLVVLTFFMVKIALDLADLLNA